MRSPLGSEADRSGACLIDPLAGRVRDQLRQAADTSRNPQTAAARAPSPRGSRRRPRRGWLMHSSVTSGSLRIGPQRPQGELERRARERFESAAAPVTAASLQAPLRSPRAVHRPDRKSTSRATKTWIRSPWALVTVGGMLTVLSQHLRHHIRGARGVEDRRMPPLFCGIHGPLHGAIDDGQKDRRAKALQEVPIHLAREARAPELIRARGAQAARRRRSACAPRSRARRCARAPARPRRGFRRPAWCRARAAPSCHRR